MNYPVWVVPVIGSGWVIGIIAIIHILISHFAVGGGIYLAFAERKARKENRKDWLEIIQKHSRFFLYLTIVAGAMTGVAIWFSIALSSPEATSALIHNFVLGWASEWTFFIIEITAIIVYYYTWNRVSAKKHEAVGWIYAISAWMSLFIINGILTFMLDPGKGWLSVAGTGAEPSKFWEAFFNPTYFPSLLMRTLVCITLAGLFAMVTASRINEEKEPKLKEQIVKWSAKWLMPAFALIPVAALWYYLMLPQANKDLFKLGVSTIGQGIFTQLTRNAVFLIFASIILFFIAYVFLWRHPKSVKLSHALLIILLAFSIIGVTEHMREMMRKPYVIGNYMYSNGIRKFDAEKFNSEGYLRNTIWTTEESKTTWHIQDTMTSEESDNLSSPIQPDLYRGELMFRGQCIACHTTNGYRSISKLLKGRDEASIRSIIDMLHEYKEDSPYRKFMPPLVGTKGEVDALIKYLDSLINKIDQ
ncbi:MAG: cytochrome ubiquinol oxidase subunit I [Acidobacteria bacterium]|nr:cytochrome ubiquinol oxidase subunit I [Acidobacteriota bacterium]